LFQGFQNIPKIPELKKRIFITLLLLAVYRIGVHVPTPGIDANALAAFFAQANRFLRSGQGNSLWIHRHVFRGSF